MHYHKILRGCPCHNDVWVRCLDDEFCLLHSDDYWERPFWLTNDNYFRGKLKEQNELMLELLGASIALYEDSTTRDSLTTEVERWKRQL